MMSSTRLPAARKCSAMEVASIAPRRRRLKPSSGSRLGGALTGIDIPTLRDVWGFGPRDVWAVGDNGAIEHYTGGGAFSPARVALTLPVTICVALAVRLAVAFRLAVADRSGAPERPHDPHAHALDDQRAEAGAEDQADPHRRRPGTGADQRGNLLSVP